MNPGDFHILAGFRVNAVGVLGISGACQLNAVEADFVAEEGVQVPGRGILNPDSLNETWGYAEPSVMEAQPGERFQFFRHGYFIADTKLTNENEKVFNRIVGLKSSWKK